MRDLLTAPVVAYPGVSMRKYEDHFQLGEVWKSHRVNTCMNENIFTIDKTTSIMKAAELMTNYGIHLLPVLSDGLVLGTISRQDIIRMTLSGD
jgi:predicted transcriptional regulator